jgi:hypothetical protein
MRPRKGDEPKERSNSEAEILNVLDNADLKAYLDNCNTTQLAEDDIFFFVRTGINKGTAFIHAKGIVVKYATLIGELNMALGSKTNIKKHLFNNVREPSLYTEAQFTLGSRKYNGPAIRPMVTACTKRQKRRGSYTHSSSVSSRTNGRYVHKWNNIDLLRNNIG